MADSDCEGEFLDRFLSLDMLRLCFALFVFGPPGMLVANFSLIGGLLALKPQSYHRIINNK